MDRLSVKGSTLRLQVDPTKEGGVVFLCRVPTWRDRLLLKNRVSREGIRFNADSAVLARARAVIEEIKPDNAAELIEAFDRLQTLRDDDEADREELASVRALINGVVDVLRRRDPELAAMHADRTTYIDLMAAVAFQMLVEGAEGEGAPAIQCRGGQVTENCMSELPTAIVDSIGTQLLTKMAPTRPEVKNSESPSPSA